MIVVTGGAGLIGSAVIWRLNMRGEENILVVDHMGKSDKWQNLVPLRFSDYLDKDEFVSRLESGAFDRSVNAIIHLGACSSTMETDAGYLMENNYHYTARLAAWREKNRFCRFIYASSAATYGDGSAGYSDKHELIPRLRPLNMYGYSKHLFDLLALRRGWLSEIAGLKYFNVYGPNEYHKGQMRSVISKAYPGVRDNGLMTLFKSHRPEYADGEQKRDFLYVKDAVDMTLFFLDNPDIGGIFNIGAGRAESWNDVSRAIFLAAGLPHRVEYVEMPDEIIDRYQYFTCADLSKLRSVGCSHECMSIDAGVKDYVQKYLSAGAHLDPFEK